MGCCSSKEDVAKKEILDCVGANLSAASLDKSGSEQLTGLKEALSDLQKSTDFVSTWSKVKRLSDRVVEMPEPLDDTKQTLQLTADEVASLLAKALKCELKNDLDFSPLYISMSSNARREVFKCIWRYFSRLSRRPAEKRRIEFSVTSLQRFEERNLLEIFRGSQKLIDEVKFSKSRIDRKDSKYVQMLDVVRDTPVFSRTMTTYGEESRYASCPEMMLAKYLVSRLRPGQCLTVKGIEKFNTCSGFGEQLAFQGLHQDKSPGIASRTVVVLDLESSVLQSGRYDMPDLIRDLTKSAVATRKPESMGRGQKVPIATSHWGFDHLLNTNTKMLRAVVQMLAASENHVDLLFCTPGEQFQAELSDLNQFFSEKNATVGQVTHILERFITVNGGTVGPRASPKSRSVVHEDEANNLFKYIARELQSNRQYLRGVHRRTFGGSDRGFAGDPDYRRISEEDNSVSETILQTH